MSKKPIEPTPYMVKDTDDREYLIVADNWTVSDDGLKFYQNDVLVAWFVRWASYRIVENIELTPEEINRYSEANHD